VDDSVSGQGEKSGCSEHGNIQDAMLSEPTEQL